MKDRPGQGEIDSDHVPPSPSLAGKAATKLGDANGAGSEKTSAAHLQAAFLHSPQPIVCIDLEGYVTHWNPAAERLFGWTADEAIGELNPTVPPEFMDEYRANLKLVANGPCDGIPIACRTKDGTLVETVLSAAPTKDDRGRPLGFVGIITDLTDRIRAQEQLLASEARYRELFEFMGDGVAVYDVVGNGEDFVFKEFNRAGERIEGLRRDALIGRRITAVFPGIGAFGLLEVLRRVWRTGRPEHFPETFYQDERISGWRDSYVYKLPSGEVVSVYKDVTDARRARQALQESEERFRSLIESTSDWIWEIDAEGRFIFSSEQVLDLLGYRSDEIRGMTPFELLPPADERRARKLFAGFQKSPDNLRHVEFEAVHRDGHPVFVECSGTSMLDDRGVFNGFRGVVHDITRRRQAQQQERDHLALLETLLDTIPNPVFYKDTNLVYQGCNQAFAAQILGLPKERIVGRSILELNPALPPDLARMYAQQDRDLLSSGGAQFYEAQAQTANGEERVFLFCKAIFRDGAGEPAGLVGVMTDLTERKRQEEATRKSEQRFRSLYESAHAGVFVHGPDLHVTEANPVALEIFGMTLEELCGRHGPHPDWVMIRDDGSPIPPEDAPSRVTLRTGEAIRGQVVGLFAQDPERLRWLTINTEPVVDEATGTVIEVITTMHDITQLKRAEQALRDKHAELDVIFRALPDAVLCTDTERRITRVNPAFTRLFGYEPEEVEGQRTRVIYADEKAFRRQGDERHHAHATEHYEPYTVDYRKKSGEVFTSETIRTPVRDAEGNVVGLLALVRDITEQLRMQEQLRQAQKMEAIGTLAGGIAHDFNNILYAIKGYTQLAVDEAPASGEMHRSLTAVLKATDRGAGLVRRLLTFARRQEETRRPLHLQKAIAELLPLLRSMLPATIEIRKVIDQDCGPVLADPVQVEQVLMNLATNAFQAMRDAGGTLEISLHSVQADDTDRPGSPDLRPGTYARLGVRDTGVGMDEDTQRRIFDPYFTTRRGGDGTGLGLSTVRAIVSKHGGAIRVRSKPQAGALFEVFLPVHAAAEGTEQDSENDAGRPQGSERILLVDDEEAIVDFLRGALERLGYEVLAFTNSPAALRAFRADPTICDLVITDQTMPAISGNALAKELLAIRPELPIILVTGYSEHIDEASAQAVGVRAFHGKPVGLGDLARTMRTLLDA